MLQLKPFLATVLLSMASLPAFSQLSYADYSTQKASVPFDSVARYTVIVKKQGKQVGLYNALGEWVIQPEYDEIDLTPFSNNDNITYHGGLIAVKKQGLVGMATPSGKIVIPCLYNGIMESEIASDVLIATSAKGRVYIDTKGNLLSPFIKEHNPEYPEPWDNRPKLLPIDPFYAGTGFTFKGTTPQMNADAQNAFANFRLLHSLSDRYYRLDIRPYSDGYAAFVFHLICLDPYRCPYQGVDNGSIGYLDSEGKIAIAPQFPSANIPRENAGYGYYWWKPDFHAGRAMIWEKETFCYIDTTGRKVFSLDYGNDKHYGFPFHPGGWTTAIIWRQENGRNVSYQDVIGRNGEVLSHANVLRKHLGTGGLLMEGPNPNSAVVTFWDSDRKERLALSADLQDTVVFSHQDEQYDYQYVYAANYIAVQRTCRADKEQSLRLVDHAGHPLTGWSDRDRFTDPFTGVNIVRENGGCRMTDRRDSLLFACDSCSFSILSDLERYPEFALRTAPGVYRFWANKKSVTINHNGRELPLEWKEAEGFVNLGEPKYQRREFHAVRYQFTKAELDQLYNQMPWKYNPPSGR